MTNVNTAGTIRIGDNPLALAALYRAGLGEKWENTTEAVGCFRALGVKVTHDRIREAVAVAEFPGELLALFAGVGMVSWTARGLLRARNEHGLATLVERARLLDPTGKSRSEILAHLSGADRSGKIRGTYKRESPLALHDRFVEGRRLNAWSTTRQAAEAMGIAHSRLVTASDVASLPQELRKLLPNESLTFELGRSLCDLVALRGAEAVRKTAIAAQKMQPRLSPERLLARIIGLDGEQFYAKVRRGAKKGGKQGAVFLELRLHPAGPDTESQLETIAELLNYQFALKLNGSGESITPASQDEQGRQAPIRRRLRGPCPLERLSLPLNLDGSAGENRNTSGNALGIDDDRAALEHWLSSYSPVTYDRYRSETERLMLWAVFRKNKPLSSLNSDDANEYINAFALNPQPSSVWVMKGKRFRDEPAWRPFRGPLSHESRRKGLRTLRKCFADLVSAQYLIANPFDTVEVDGESGDLAETEYTELA
ncbi:MULTISPECIES: hypothetical protein [Paraburkholderia]|uniref:hypothetical protein n=1 Tax=Paraburkholderia TaxID=1822464 RepID=UPI0038B7FB10